MTPEERIDAAASRYRRTKAAYEAARDELQNACVLAIDAKVKPVVVSRRSGWDREYIRRLVKRARARLDGHDEGGEPA
jgi:methylmalonyl-CoA mutase cobalamin-binding subunit